VVVVAAAADAVVVTDRLNSCNAVLVVTFLVNIPVVDIMMDLDWMVVFCWCDVWVCESSNNESSLVTIG
jgi:hypothetical protein